MKYLQLFNIFENRSIDQMIDKYKKKGKTINKSDYEYFKKMTHKLPNNFRKLLSWLLEGESASDVLVVYDYYLNLRNRNLNVPDINQFKKPEDLYDDLQTVENNFKINKIVQELPSNLKSQYKRLNDKTEINSLFHQLSEKDEKNQLIKKISRYKTIEELSNVIINLLTSPNGYSDMVFSIENDPDSDLIYFKNGIIIAKINDYNSSCRLGSSSWCISTNIGYFDSYTTGRDQYFIWDFNLKTTDPLSLIGLTKNNITEISLFNNTINQGSSFIDLQIRNVHDRNDRSISKNIHQILKDKKIPFGVIFETNEKELMFDILKKSRIDQIFTYLNINYDLTDNVLDFIMKNRSIDDIISLNQKIVFFKTKNIKLSNRLNKETLHGYLSDLYENDKEKLLKMCMDQPDPIYAEYFYKLANTFISVNDLIDYIKPSNEKSINDHINNHYVNHGRIRKIISSRIEMIENIDEKFEYLFKWHWGSQGMLKPSRTLLLSISEDNNKLLKPNNKLKALKLTKNNFEASKLFKDINIGNLDINNFEELRILLFNIFQYKPKIIYKNEFIDNVIRFIKRLVDENYEMTIRLTENLDFKYMGMRSLELFNIFNNKNDFKDLYDYIDTSYYVGNRLRSKAGWECLKRVDYIDDGIIYKTLQVSTPKDIRDNITLLKDIISKISNISHKHIYVLMSGNHELIVGYYGEIIDHIELYINKKYYPDFSRIISTIYMSKKLTHNDFTDIMRPILNMINSEGDERFLEIIMRKTQLIEGDEKKKGFILTPDPFNI